MIKFLLIALLILALTASVAIFIAILQSKKAKKAQAETKTLHEAFWAVKEKAERLQKTLDIIDEIEGKADAEKKELEKTPDSALVDRANGLFNK